MCVCVCVCVCVCICAYYVASVMSHSLQPYGLGIQARILEWVAMPFPGDIPDPGIKPLSPALAGGFFTTSATWEAYKCVCVCVCVNQELVRINGRIRR